MAKGTNPSKDDANTSRPHRRWQFNLRTLLGVTAALCLVFAAIAWMLNSREREVWVAISPFLVLAIFVFSASVGSHYGRESVKVFCNGFLLGCGGDFIASWLLLLRSSSLASLSNFWFPPSLFMQRFVPGWPDWSVLQSGGIVSGLPNPLIAFVGGSALAGLIGALAALLLWYKLGLRSLMLPQERAV